MFVSYLRNLSLGFGDFVPLASIQRTGQSLYSHWGYFIFTISFILFGLAIMASSLNLLVLRLAQFHSENRAGGMAALLGRNEEDLIAAAVAQHRASIFIQRHNRLCSNSNSINPSEKTAQSYRFMRAYSWNSASSSSCSSSSNSRFHVTDNSKERSFCSRFSLFSNQKRKRHYWHLRRSPQNIKHLLYFDNILQNHELTLLRKPLSSHLTNHLSAMNLQKKQRISI
jgi:hypothetical protein